MNEYFMLKPTMVILNMNKINMAKPTMHKLIMAKIKMNEVLCLKSKW